MSTKNDKTAVPVIAWLGLLALTLVSLVLGNRFGHADWMPLIVAGIIWIKGTLVAKYFIESDNAHYVIALIIKIFIAFVPVALVLTSFFGR
jgi:hypothetical protein